MRRSLTLFALVAIMLLAAAEARDLQASTKKPTKKPFKNPKRYSKFQLTVTLSGKACPLPERGTASRQKIADALCAALTDGLKPDYASIKAPSVSNPVCRVPKGSTTPTLSVFCTYVPKFTDALKQKVLDDAANLVAPALTKYSATFVSVAAIGKFA